MRARSGSLSLPVNGEQVRVPAVPHLRCPRCGEVVLRPEGDRRLHDGALRIHRARHRLLSPDEIRALRRRFGLTQAGLARLLRLGNNTVSRWEAGRNVQTAAMDVLLRLIRDLPGSLAYLRKRVA
jgi:putative zinc finger/helix-turn-helix YgiT family protein